MAETYISKYANGEAVDAALDKAESALQAADVVNALDSTATDAPLSAAQGKVLNDGKVSSDPTDVTGADRIANLISLTQAEYDAIASPDDATLYVITD